jgi:hypothetical protein
MALQFEITKEAHEALDAAVQGLYTARGDGFRLEVSGIDPADELKEALRKEREERANAKTKLKEFEDAKTKADQLSLEEKQEFEKLWKAEQEKGTTTAKELDDLRTSIAQKDRNSEAYKIVSTLATDTARAEILQQQAMPFISHTPEGIKINGPDGEAWDAAKLTAHLKEKYPFLVDGSKASGGGATGGGTGGGAAKKFHDYTGAEKVVLLKDDPSLYAQLKKAQNG